MNTLRWLGRNWVQIVILVVPFVVIAHYWDRFPAKVAVHWGFDGRPNGWGTKATGLLAVPFISIGMAILLGWIPALDPRLRRNAESSGRTVALIVALRYIITAMMASGSLIIAAEALGHHLNLSRAVANVVILLFLVMGNYMGNVRPNYFAGIRTPWTLENDEVWKATHRLAGRMLVFGCLALLVLQFFVSLSVLMPIVIGFVIATALVAVAYSWWLYRGTRPAPPPG
jgi:uncharacterized membrane protein